MALGLNLGSASNFLPRVSFNARSGRMYKVDRSPSADGWTNVHVDITVLELVFAIDFSSMQTGWLFIGANGPNLVMNPLGQGLPAQPSADHKQGFRCKIAGKILGGVREFSHTAKCVVRAMDALHSQYEASPEAALGKVPIVRLSRTVPVVTKGPAGNTTNYAPVFEIVGWTDRLPEFGDRTVPLPIPSGVAPPAPPQPAPTTAAPVVSPEDGTPPAGGGAVPTSMPFARY